jgi:chromosome segregation ATPase
VDARAELTRREQELTVVVAAELAQRRDELEREAAEARERLRAGSGERLDRERAGLQEQLEARERELARREDEMTRLEIELSVVRRRIGDEEQRLQERAWRTGALERRASSNLPVRPERGRTFSDGWGRLARGGDSGDAPDGSW